MVQRLQPYEDMAFEKEEGTVLTTLSFEAEGVPSGVSQPTVLSCGGIYIPQRKIPKGLKKWHQIVNLPGHEMSAKIFGYGIQPTEDANTLDEILKKEPLN